MTRTLKLLYSLVKAVILCLFFISPNITYAAPLAGSYTIGGSSPDYTKIQSAIDDLKSNGISASVIFNIRTGVYTEQLKIPSIKGSSKTSTITFQSQTGKAKDVVIKHEHTSQYTDKNFTLFVDGADHVIFQNLTLQALSNGSSFKVFNRVIYITNNSDHLSFKNNDILSWRSSKGSFEENDAVFIGSDYNTSFENDTIEFINNTILGGYRGIHFQGSASAQNFQTSGLVIQDNTFYDQFYNAIRVLIGKNTKITGNIIDSRGNNIYIGIDIYQHSDSLIINANKLDLYQATSGITISYLETGAVNFKVISNNSIFLSTDRGSAMYGIHSSHNAPYLMAHNTIYLTKSKSTSAGFFSTNRDSITIYNNIFHNSTAGLCYYVTNTSNCLYVSDYNNLYTTGSTLVKDNTTDYGTITAITSGLNLEKKSLTADSKFLNNKLLIPYESSILNAGMQLSTVTTDYFGTKRTTTPSMGMFESTVPSNDAGLPRSDSDNSFICPNEDFVIVTDLKNYGLDTLTTASIYYTVNDTVKGPYQWKGSLPQNKWVYDIVLGKINTSTPTSIKIWVSLPNGKQDELTLNDTLFITSILAKKGSYTVGTASSDYLTLQQAVDDLAATGICGPVVLNVKTGIYKVQTEINSIPGASKQNTITIQSELQDSTTVSFEYSATNTIANYVVKLNKCAYVILNHLQIKPTGSKYSQGVLVENSSNNQISHCLLYGRQVQAHIYFYHSLIRVLSGNTLSENNVFNNNTFINGGHQISLFAYASNVSSNNSIQYNYFGGRAGRSIYAESQDSLLISNNRFSGYRTSNEAGIYLRTCKDNIAIESNIIALDGNGPVLFKLNGCVASDSTKITIKNNFSSAFGNGYSVGLEMDRCEYIDVLHNNFNMHSDNANGVRFANELKSVRLLNNIFGSSKKSILYRSFYTMDTVNVLSDYNCFYSKSQTPFEFEKNQSSYLDYLDSFQQDQHSIFTIPNYISDSNLHINNTVEINRKGFPIASIKYDIDGELRDTIPDIGADEFEIDSSTLANLELIRISNPDSTSCAKPDSLSIVIKNHSSFSIDSFTLKYWLWDQLQDSLIIKTTLPPNGTIKYNIAKFIYSENTLYDFKFQVSKPNGKVDAVFKNNTKQLQYAYLSTPLIHKLKGPCDTETELFITTIPHKRISWSTGETSQRILVNKKRDYDVEVTDKKGCKVKTTITLN